MFCYDYDRVLPPFLAGLKAKIIHKKEKKKEHLQERYTLQLATS